MYYLIRADVPDTSASRFFFEAQKTMYGGKNIARGDTIYLFASETVGGAGLFARGVVVSVESTPRKRGVARQTPRVSIAVRRTARAKRRLGRDDVKAFRAWKDGQPQTELNFKFFRQATHKIGGISNECAEFIDGYF